MTELALYLNTEEPKFPFELIRPQLSRFLTYLSESISDNDYDEPFLNIILVFTRARTSALLPMCNWNKVGQLVQCLNAVAESIGTSHRKLALDKLE
jgi:hypothetical protein